MLALMPGPDNIFVAIQSISYGKRHGIATVLGLVTGCLIHTVMVAVGLSALIKSNDHVFSLLIVLGALYLLFLAYQVYRSKPQINLSNSTAVPLGVFQSYKRGVVMNVLNPKVGIFFLAFFPGFLFSNSINVSKQFLILGVLFALITLFIFTLITFFASYLKRFAHAAAPLFWIKWIQIGVFILLALYILWSHFYSYF